MLFRSADLHSSVKDCDGQSLPVDGQQYCQRNESLFPTGIVYRSVCEHSSAVCGDQLLSGAQAE